MRFMPTTVQWEGTSRVTTALAPTVAPRPTRTAPRIFAPGPMNTLSSITGECASCGCFAPMVTWCITVTRLPRVLPTMRINPDVKDIFAFRYEDFALEGYDPHPHIRAEVAV